MWDKRPDMVVHEADPYNAEPPPTALGDLVTPTDTFYVRNHGPVPVLDPATWRLRVDGDVDTPLELDLAAVKSRFAHHRRQVTLQCAGNRRAGLLAVRDIPGEHPWGGGATGSAWWTGVSLADVLRAAGIRGTDGHVAFEAPDVSRVPPTPEPFGGSIETDRALAGDVLLAFALNDEDLPPVHGAPLRVVVPGYIGARSVKWLTRIVVQDEPSTNYFQAHAYRLLPPQADPDEAGPGDGISLAAVALGCEITAPDAGAQMAAGPVTVGGYAHAGTGRRVERVDVRRFGDEAWTTADLAEDLPGVWRRWTAILELPAGAVRIQARAWDSTGACQPADAADLWNPKGYVNHSWAEVDLTVR